MNFKYEIGEKTDLGIIKSRYYWEWINRNGGFCNGDFYEMENGKTYAEFLINRIEAKFDGIKSIKNDL